MLKIQIKSKIGELLFEYEKKNNTIKDTVEEAVKQGANLDGAYLEEANLRGAYLGGANLRGAYLYKTDDDLEKISEGNEAIKIFEEQTNIKIIKTYINKHILSPYYSIYWKNGLIIDEYEYKEPLKKMTLEQIKQELGYDFELVVNKEER